MTAGARAAVVGLGLAGLVLLTACEYQGVTSLPLPGAIDGADTYQVTAVFDDATNLVPKETCRANDVVVGSVRSVTVGPDLRAHVTCSIKRTAVLPGNAIATLGNTSLLGERFVAFDPPRGAAPQGRLALDSVVPVSGTRADPDTEQVLGTLSMVLNGGSVGQIQTISSELNQAMTGHETDIRSLLDRLVTLTGELDRNKADITGALDSMDRLSATVAEQRGVLGEALESVPEGLTVLNNQRDHVVDLLAHLSDLSDAAVPVINASKDNVVADLRALNPVLDNLAKSGRQIAPALEMLSYPFPANAEAAIKGDYVGLYARVNLDLDSVNTLLREQAGAPLSNRGGAGTPPSPIPAPLPLPPALDDPGVLPSPAPNLDDLLSGGGR